MNKSKKSKVSRADLNRKIKELESQLAFNYAHASMKIHKASDLMASGVILELTALGGNKIIEPVMIVDGLSKETVESLKKDIVRSWKRATEQKPKDID